MAAPLKILLVEDSDDDVFFFKRSFKRTEYAGEVLVAPDGAEAIKLLTRQENPAPDIVFLDLKMPNQNGFEVLEWMRKNPKLAATKIYVLTSSSEPRERERAKELGADDYFLKPMASDQLREALQGT